MQTFEAPKAEQYLTLTEGKDVQLRVLDREGQHDKFELRGEPAPVFRVQPVGSDQKFRWTITSGQLKDTLDLVEAKLGPLEDLVLHVLPKGEGTDRVYKIGAEKAAKGKGDQKLS